MTRRVLLVEDDSRSRRLMKVLLSASGYEVIEATNSEEAQDLLRTERPDLILLDVRLPNTNGLTLTKSIRDQPETKDTPIIAVTAYAMKGDKEKAMEAGCNAYISKPIDTRELLNLIASLIKKN